MARVAIPLMVSTAWYGGISLQTRMQRLRADNDNIRIPLAIMFCVLA